jgi:peptide/nickel transport system substrate-binding protein
MRKNQLLLLALVVGLGGLASMLCGCAPPPQPLGDNLTGKADTGRAIQTILATPKAPFTTVELNGVEYRQARGGTGQRGGTFYDNQLGEGPKTFNPWASFDATSSAVGGMLASGLIDTDPYTGMVIPAMAKTITVLPDHRTYRLTLRKGLRWSDGQPLTSADVLFTWTEIIAKGLGNASTRDNLLVDGQFPTVRAVDPWTIEWVTAKPFAPFLRQLGQPVAPKHVFKPVLDAEKTNEDKDKAFSSLWGVSDATDHPERFVSSGLWVLERYQPSERVVFKRNPYYWGVDAQHQHLPYLDRSVMTFAKDMNRMALQFEQGQVDSYGITGKSLPHIRRLRVKHPQDDFTIYNLGPTSSTTFMAFNLNTRPNKDTGKPLVDPIHQRWFADKRFRQALDWAIDRDVMVQNILNGVGEPLFTAEGLPSIYLNRALAKGHPRSLARAKQLLQQAGFRWQRAGTSNPDMQALLPNGQLQDATGHPVTLDLLTNAGNDQREATGISMKQDLAELGIIVNFKPIDFNVLVGKMNTGDWDCLIMGLTGSPLEPQEGANVWKSNGSLHLFNQRDVKALAGRVAPDRLPWEVEIDRLYEAGAQTFNVAQRKALYGQFQAIVADQCPMLYLYSPLSLVAIRTRLHNVDPTPLGVFHNMDSIWVDP